MGARRGSACPRNKRWWFIPDSFETKQVSAELHVERIRDAGRFESEAAGEGSCRRSWVGGKISANFLRVSIAYIIVYSCMQRFTVADRW